MGQDEKRKEKDKEAICLSLVSLSQEEQPYQCLEICCCVCDIISCSTPPCRDLGELVGWLIWTLVFSQQARRNFSLTICLHHRRVFVSGICGSPKSGFMFWVACGAKGKISILWSKAVHSRTLQLSWESVHLYACFSLFVQVPLMIDFDIICPQMFISCDTANPSACGVPHITLHFYG